MNRKGFVHKLCLTVGFKECSAPERTSINYLEIKHTHTQKASFCPHWALLNSKKFVMPENMYLCSWAKANVMREVKARHFVLEWLSGCAEKDHIKRPNWFCENEFWELGLWMRASSLSWILGRHLSLYYLYLKI